MTESLESSKLKIHKHLKQVMLDFVADDGVEQSSEDELDAEDFATMVISVLGLNVASNNLDGTISCTLNLSANVDSIFN